MSTTTLSNDLGDHLDGELETELDAQFEVVAMNSTNSSSGTTKQKKKLPMIVDISIDNSGKQIYQIHETSKMIRKEMPISTFNKEGSTVIANANTDGNSDDKTPVRNILGTLSPSTLNQKRKRSLSIGSDGEDYEEEFIDNDVSGHHRHRSLNDLDTVVNRHSRNSSASLSQNVEGSPRMSVKDEGEVWGPDVEEAFEEALKIIPKNGLTKIKISGRSCGRNELISDFILQKTGKLRTRKQVSSHIQVHKNMGKNVKLIDLINNGPKNSDCIKKFDEIFSEITFQKSIGESIISSNSVSNAGIGSNLNVNTNSIPKFKKKRMMSLPPTKIKISIEKFSMKFYKNNQESFVFTKFNKNLNHGYNYSQDNLLKINDDSNIDIRFPGLLDFSDLANLPIIHNLCKLNLPKSNSFKLSNGEMNSDLKIKLIDNEHNEDAVEQEHYSIFTTIYSFGNEVLKLNESLDFEVNESNPREKDFSYQFLNKFWLFFLKNLIENSDENAKNIAFKNITIKQIIYKNMSSTSTNHSPDLNQNPLIMKKNIKSILLWEFVKLPCAVDSEEENITISNYLKLPNQKQELLTSSIKCDSNIKPQSIKYTPPNRPSNSPHNPQRSTISQSPQDPASSASSTFIHYPLTSSTTMTSEFTQPPTAASMISNQKFVSLNPHLQNMDENSPMGVAFSSAFQQQCFQDQAIPFGGYMASSGAMNGGGMSMGTVMGMSVNANGFNGMMEFGDDEFVFPGDGANFIM